jgi:hypothetical protein
MFILIEHEILEPQRFWANAQDMIPQRLPTGITLHHSFPDQEGTRCVCVWEAETTAALRDTLEPELGRYSRNRYYEVENREGIFVPAQFVMRPQAV